MRRMTCRATARMANTDAMKSSCPISTPTLKLNSASGMSSCGRPISDNAPAKPKPCSRPNVKATTHGAARSDPASLPAMHDLRRDENDAQRDDGLDRRRRHVDESRAPRD